MTRLSLQKQRDLVALEALNVSDLSQLVGRVFPAIRAGFTNLLGMFGQQNHEVLSLSAPQRDFSKLLTTRNYVDLMPLTAYVPEGLRCSYLEYERELTPAVMHACNIAKVLDPYATYLAVLLSAHDGMLTTKSHAREYQALAKEREAYNRRLGACFTKGSTRTEVKLQDVIHRNSDWPTLFKSTETMTSMINGIDRKYLDKKIHECTELLDSIAKKVERGEYQNVSPEAVMWLSDGAYAVAEELEFFSATYYRVLAYTTSVDRTLKHVLNVSQNNPEFQNHAGQLQTA